MLKSYFFLFFFKRIGVLNVKIKNQYAREDHMTEAYRLIIILNIKPCILLPLFKKKTTEFTKIAKIFFP